MSSDAPSQRTPRVSIVMTAYNHERFVGRAVESCLAQTLTDFELIVINDGSQDGTEEVLRSFADPRIVLINQENQGPSLAFNAGLCRARGEYIALMSGDDVCEPHRLERQWEASRAHPGVVLFGHVSFIDEEEVPLPLPDWTDEVFNVPAMSRTVMARRFLAHGNFLSAPTAFIPRDLLHEVGYFNPSLFQLQDFDLWLRLLARTDLRVLPIPLVRYRYHRDNLSRPSHQVSVATQNELELVYTAFFRSLTLNQFHGLFEIPAPPQDAAAEPYLDMEIAFFLRLFGRTLLDRIAITFLHRALSTPEGADTAYRHFGYSPRAFWGDLKQLEPSVRIPPLEPDADRLHRRAGKDEVGKTTQETPPPRPAAFLRRGLGRMRRVLPHVGRRMQRLREQAVRFGLPFSLTYLAAVAARRLLKSFEQPLLETASRYYAYHPVTNLRLAERLGKGQRALLLYKRAFLAEATLFMQQPHYLKPFIALLRAAGRTFELQMLRRKLDSFGLEQSSLEAAFSDLAIADPFKPKLDPERPIPHGLLFSLLDLKPLDAWLGENRGTCRVFRDRSSYEFRLPTVFGEPAATEPLRLEVPASSLSTVHDVLVGPGFTVVSPEKQALILYEPAAHPRFGNVSGLRGMMSQVPGQPDRVRLQMTTTGSLDLEEAALLSGRCSINYYHWLIEYLPRLLEIEASGALDEVPLLVSDQMPFQHYEALFAMLGKDRPVVYVDPTMAVAVGTLHIPSFSTYVPDDFGSSLWKMGGVSQEHVEFVRRRLLAAQEASGAGGFGRRIFLSRSRNAGRSMSNELAIVAACKRAGFTVVYPELLSFHEQVACFSQAEVIMGPTGAAFANVIFCQPGTRIFGLTSERLAGFCNFANLATSVGCEFVNVTGANNRPRAAFADEESFAHSSFTVPLAKIEAILAALDGR